MILSVVECSVLIDIANKQTYDLSIVQFVKFSVLIDDNKERKMSCLLI
jgi:hypothetical protein